MNDIFKPYLRKFIMVFFDDILVYSQSLEEHKGHLKKTLTVLRQYHFFIKPFKCEFMKEELEYIRHIISGKGVMVDQ